VVANRTCKSLNDDGGPCGAAPLHGSDFCFVHAPEYAEEMAENRRLGGHRRRRERTLAVAYDFEGLDSVDQIRRLIEIAALDMLGLENSVNRSRTLISAALAAAKLLEIGAVEERLAILEAALGPRLVKQQKDDRRPGRRPWWKP
jgi:predicted transcriptional regulator